MNDRKLNQPDPVRDHEWTTRLSRLRHLPFSAGGRRNGGEKFPGSLAGRARNRSGPLRGAADRFAGFWETVLVLSIFLLMAWDLFHAIRLLLG